jgi:microtubule-associated protein-like 1/2
MVSGKWMVLDSNTREIYGIFQDGGEALQTAKFSPDGKFLVLGSRDGILYIYQVSDGFKKYHRMGRCLVSSIKKLGKIN